LKGDEEVVGGFDLIYRGKEVAVGPATAYTSMLGCRNNREDNLKKLARATAYRLANEAQ
jgi:tubulin polyglutamylase TTLL9